MIHIAALNEADADYFYKEVVEGRLPLFGYPNIKEELEQGYTIVTGVEHLGELEKPTGQNLIYTPQFAMNPNAGDVLDAVALLG